MIIFTDLDGSLLNHGDYSCAEAKPAIERIKHAGIPLILTTSKTRPEVELLQREIGIREPFIVENGAGIFFPRGYRNWAITGGMLQGDYTLIRIGTTYAAVRHFVAEVGKRFGVRGFGDMSREEIATRTGLSADQAEMAKAREFTEPFVLKRPDDLVALGGLAAEAGLKVTRGGRFHHLIGQEQDKGVAVRIVTEFFRVHTGKRLTTVGLGDSENDLPMLELVDIPVLIPRPSKGHLDLRIDGLIRAAAPGGKGWNKAVERLLDDYPTEAAEKIPHRQEER